jgi:hypothetical protein
VGNRAFAGNRAQRHHDQMPVELADGFAGRLLEYCDQARVVLRDAQPPALAVDAMKAARRRLYQVPHPDEDEPFIHFAGEVTEGPDGPTFFFDAADAGHGGVLDALISALLAGLTEAGLTGGTLDCLLAGRAAR